jgi:hypothetical protein
MLKALGLEVTEETPPPDTSPERQQILDALEKGEVTAAEAADRLRSLAKR